MKCLRQSEHRSDFSVNSRFDGKGQAMFRLVLASMKITYINDRLDLNSVRGSVWHRSCAIQTGLGKVGVKGTRCKVEARCGSKVKTKGKCAVYPISPPIIIAGFVPFWLFSVSSDYLGTK